MHSSSDEDGCHWYEMSRKEQTLCSCSVGLDWGLRLWKFPRPLITAEIPSWSLKLVLMIALCSPWSKWSCTAMMMTDRHWRWWWWHCRELQTAWLLNPLVLIALYTTLYYIHTQYTVIHHKTSSTILSFLLRTIQLTTQWDQSKHFISKRLLEKLNSGGTLRKTDTKNSL